MREIIWTGESDRPEQRVALIAAIIYCAAILIDGLIISIPYLYFQFNIVIVGIGYFISSYKSKQMLPFISIGILWIFIGIITGINFKHTLFGIPIAIIGSSSGYFLIMSMIAIVVIIRRSEYKNTFLCIISAFFASIMAVAHIIAFLGIATNMKFLYVSDFFDSVGRMVINISQYSTIEFMSMAVVLVSMLLQSPQMVYVYNDIDD